MLQDFAHNTTRTSQLSKSSLFTSSQSIHVTDLLGAIRIHIGYRAPNGTGSGILPGILSLED